jgi:OmpA-OmpF porin, OOP family
MHASRLARAAVPAALLWAAAASAQGPDAGQGWYLGKGIQPAQTAFATTEDTDIGYRNFGGFRFTSHWGVEFGYSDLGHGNGAGIAEPGRLYSPEKYGAQTSAWTLAGTGVLPIGESLSLLGRVGWSLAAPDATLAGFSLGTAAPGFGVGSAVPRYRGGVMWGFGGQVDLSNRLGLRVDYNNFGKLEDPSSSRSDLWSINAVVRF